MVELSDDGSYKPYRMDFGPARDAGDHAQSMTGGLAGTPAFMAPEQARGDYQSR
jgi:serine/threonine-protein kinase